MKNESFEAKACLDAKDVNEITIEINDTLYEKYSELLIKINDIISKNKKRILKK